MNHGVGERYCFKYFKKKNLKSDNGQRENYYLVLKCGSQVSPSNDSLTRMIIKVDVKIKETIFFEIFCFRKFHVTPCHTHQKFGNRRLVNCPQIFIMAFFPFINHAYLFHKCNKNSISA